MTANSPDDDARRHPGPGTAQGGTWTSRRIRVPQLALRLRTIAPEPWKADGWGPPLVILLNGFKFHNFDQWDEGEWAVSIEQALGLSRTVAQWLASEAERRTLSAMESRAIRTALAMEPVETDWYVVRTVECLISGDGTK